LAFPKDELNSSESPMVHFYDVIFGYQGEIDFHALGTSYKNAIEKHDLQQLPSPLPQMQIR
jgi:hypothetical protein